MVNKMVKLSGNLTDVKNHYFYLTEKKVYNYEEDQRIE